MLIEEAVRIVQRRWRKPLRPLEEKWCDGCLEQLPMLEACCTVFDSTEFPWEQCRRYRVPGDYHTGCATRALAAFSAEVESLRWCPSWGDRRPAV